MLPDGLKDLKDLKSLFPDMASYKPDPADELPEDNEAILTDKEKAAMKIYVSRDKKHRAGKQVTLVEGHTGPEAVRQQLYAEIKSHCSAGGSYKDEVILVQGDHVRKVLDFLLKKGYKQVKQKGG
jgi:translation initiation factor 1